MGNSELKSQALLPLTMGMWIGGDRDGNPYVTVNTLEQSAQEQAIKLFQHYLDVVREIYRDLSMSISMTNVTEELQNWLMLLEKFHHIVHVSHIVVH